jgi:hypothetical protein
MGLHADDITDLANQTLNDLGRLRLVEVASEITEYIAAANLLNKYRIKFDGGKGITWNFLQNGDENARNVGLYNRDNINVKDGTFKLDIPWRHSTTGCAFDVREDAMNSGPAKIVDYIATKRFQRAISWVELMEENFWQGPDGSTDEDTPFGVFGYWLAYNATSGFNGSNGNYGTIGGKNCDTYDKLKHYTFQYTSVSDTDLIDSIRDTLVYTDFKPMVSNAPVKGYSNGMKRIIYGAWPQIKTLEKLARSQNDDLGSNLDKYRGMVRIGQVPVTHAPWITENKATSLPFVGIDWSQFHAVFRTGWWMKETPFAVKDGQHNVRESHMDCTYNFRCYDRRKGLWLGAKSDPLAA